MKCNQFWEVPSSVDLKDFLKKYPPGFKYKIDHFYYIIDYLCRGMELEDLDSNKGFVNLNAKKLQKVNSNYKKYLDHLLQHRFIRTDKKFIIGQKSFGFCINKYKYHKATVERIPITDWTIIRRKIRENEEHQNDLTTTERNYHHLTKWFNKDLRIDPDGANKKVEELFPKQTGLIGGTKRGKASGWAKRYKAICSLKKIANQEFYYNVDENVGRFHSNLTNIKRELRNYITYAGQKLVSVDIKNAQPLFSTLFFHEDFYTEKSQHINIFDIPTSHLLLSNNSSLSSFTFFLITILKILKNSDKEEVNRYIDMVNSGQFYWKISQLIYPNIPLDKFDKQSMKTKIFSVFFSSNRFIGQPGAEFKRDFEKHFPCVYNIFKIIKTKNHRALAHLTQRIESTIMIQNVVLRISNENPELPIFTIHDSVLTTSGNEKYVESIIREEVLNLTGLKARLEIQYL